MRSYHITLVSLSVLSLVLAAAAAHVGTAGATPYPVNKVSSGLIVSDSLTTGNTANWIQGGTAQSYDFYEDSQGLHIGVQSPQSGQWVNRYAYSSQPQAYLFHAAVTIPDTVVPDGVSNIGLYVEGSDFIPHVGCEAYADSTGYYWVVEQSNDAGNTYNILYITQPNSLPQTQDCTIITNGSNYLKVYIGGNAVFSSTSMNLGMSGPLIAYFQGDTSSSNSMHYATYRNYYTTSDENITITNNPPNAATAKIVGPSGQTLASSPVASGTATLNVGKYNFPLSATINVYDSNNSIIASSPATIYGGDVYSTDVPSSTVPQPPTGLTSTAASSSRINLSWAAPSNDGGSPITGYKIERSVSGGAFSVLVANTGSTATSHSDTGLSAGTTYTYRVSAINAVGPGSPSNTASAATMSSPSKPTSLAASAFSFSQIDLSWVAPGSSGGSAIVGYKIERSGDGGSTWGAVATNTGTTATEYSDTGLEPSTTYTYRVSAINAVGTGPPSDTAFATTSQQPPRPITLESSGLISYDPLNNETKTRQELEASQGFWHYDGSAFSLFNPPAPTDLFKDSQGLHLGVKTPTNGTYAGYYAVTPVPATATESPLFHAKITTPVRTIPSDFFQNGLYVQTDDGRINYVTCVSITGNAGTSWHVVRTYGTFIEATSFEVLYSEYGANLPLTRDCTIITNGNNYLKVYLDGVNVYTNSTMDLQMPAPYLYFLEPQNDHTQMLYGIYEDYYSTKGETIQVNALPAGASRADLVGPSGNVLSTAPVTGGAAALDVGKYHYPLTANIKVYDSGNAVVASTPSAAGMFGGDVFTVNADSPPGPTAPAAPSGLSASTISSSQINLAWNAPNDGGSPITGYKIERSPDGAAWSVLMPNTGTTATEYSDTGLNPGTIYAYRVSAINAVGAGSPSNAASATTAAPPSGVVINNIQATSGITSAPNKITLSNFNAGTGDNRLLVVGVQANNNDAASVTFGGVPLAKRASSFYNDDAEFWYLANPGGVADIVVTMNGPTSVVVGAYSVSGVDLANPIPTSAVRHNVNPNSPAVSITTAYPNSMVLDLPSMYGGVTLSSPTCAQSWDLNVPDQITGASSSVTQASAGAVACGWTASGNDFWDDIAIEIKAS